MYFKTVTKKIVKTTSPKITSEIIFYRKKKEKSLRTIFQKENVTIKAHRKVSMATEGGRKQRLLHDH